VFTISAMRGHGTGELRGWLLARARPSPWEFAAEVVTDRNVAEMSLELVKEQLYRWAGALGVGVCGGGARGQAGGSVRRLGIWS
jgi:hypothetical protein